VVESEKNACVAGSFAATDDDGVASAAARCSRDFAIETATVMTKT